MKVLYSKIFSKDIDKILHNKKICKKLENTIIKIKNANTFNDLGKLKKMQRNDVYYRIKIGDYRLGIKKDNGAIVLLRFLHRKDIYRYFP